MSNYGFDLHEKLTDSKAEYAYRGTAFFHPDQSGRYTFVITVRPFDTRYGSFDCSTELDLNGDKIVGGESNLGHNIALFENDKIVRSQTFSGGADLESIDYKASFEVNCYHDVRNRGDSSGRLFPFWHDIKFSIMVKGPDDEKARPFESNELFHVGKAKKS